MGDFTPEAMEVQCPGCNSHFRIRPKSENIENATVSCPKCFADIPVESSRLPAGSSPSADLSQVDVGFSRIETRRSSVFAPQKTPTSTIRSLTAPKLDDDEQDAISKLERLSLGTFTEPDTIRSTFSGFPGRTSDNPFQRAKTTASTQSPLLQEFINLDQQQSDAQSASSSSLTDVHSEATQERDTPEILQSKDDKTNKSSKTKDAHLRQTSELDAVTIKNASRSSASAPSPNKNTDTNSDEAQQSQIISKLRARLPLAQTEPVQPDATTGMLSQEDSEALSSYSDTGTSDGTTGVLKADAIPEEYRDWHDFPTSDDPSLAVGSTLDIAPEQKSSEPDTTNTENASETSSEPTLAKLFKRAQKRRASLETDPSTKKPSIPTPKTVVSPVSNPAISVDITEDEVASILDSSTELSKSKIVLSETSRSTIPGLQPIKTIPPKLPPTKPGTQSVTKPDSKPDAKPAAPFSLKEKLATTESSGIHDGLFADVPRAAEQPPHPITHDSIVVRPDRSGKTTSQSMLARLRQRRESMEIDAAIASENRGSGFIRLPTAEIQQVLGRGTYRLLIEDIVYEPVDKDGLIQLIKGGVLLGAEQIAEADGDWMPVSQHPVFDELRRRFAAEAHALLSRISSPRDAAQNELNTNTTQVDPIPPQIITPALSDAVSDPLLAIPEEPNFAVLTDSEADHISPTSETTDEPEDQHIAEPAETPAPEPIVQSLFEPVSEPTPEARIPAVDSTDELDLEDPPKSKKGLLLVLLLLILTVSGVYLLSQSNVLKSLQPEKAASTQVVATAPKEEIPNKETSETNTIAESADNESKETEIAKVPEKESKDSDFAKNTYLTWQTSDKDQPQSLATARKLLEQQDFKRARAVAAYGMAVFDPSDNFQELFQQSILDDKDLHASEALEPVALFSINGIRIEGDGKNQRIILTRDGADRFIFKPSRTELRDAWRSEIAAYRLCEMILCNFEIPHTAPALITREQWDNMAPNSELTEKLAWETTSKDSQKIQFVQGALQELVPKTTPWPIEITGLWRDWLGTAPTFNALDQEFVEAHDRIKNFGDGTIYQAILEQQNNTTTRQLAEQVSTLILFDFLTNNWERFSGNSANYGRGTPFAQGKIISFNNGQSFQARASRRVLGRFEWTGRFSRSTVAAVRALTPELANSVLFDDPTGIERARLDVLWNQHRQAISRIDASIERHGKDLIFPFD